MLGNSFCIVKTSFPFDERVNIRIVKEQRHIAAAFEQFSDRKHRTGAATHVEQQFFASEILTQAS
jgi:hypothetical protein